MKETMTSNNNRKNSGSVIDETIADAERKLKQQLLGKLKDRENELIAVEAERKEKAIEKKELYTQEQEKLVDQRKSGLVDREWKRNCAKEDREWESEEAEKKLQRDFDRAEKKAQAEFTRELALQATKTSIISADHVIKMLGSTTAVLAPTTTIAPKTAPILPIQEKDIEFEKLKLKKDILAMELKLIKRSKKQDDDADDEDWDSC